MPYIISQILFDDAFFGEEGIFISNSEMQNFGTFGFFGEEGISISNSECKILVPSERQAFSAKRAYYPNF